ncbi:MAG: DUF5658 family protein [Acidiferrobacterales bacterium]
MSPKRSEVTELSPHPSIATPQQLVWLDGVVKAVIVLNLLDIVFTLVWVGAGRAQETNLLLNNLVANHPIMFALVKIGLVSLGSFLLWKHRGHPFAVVGIFSIFVVYYFVLLYHLHFTSVYISPLTVL